MRFLTILSSAGLAVSAVMFPVQATLKPSDLLTAATDQWRAMMKQPPVPHWNDFNCKPTADNPNPLVLIHGLGSQGERHWKTFAPRFAAKGYCVFTPTYGSMLGQTLVNGLDSIANSAQEISEYVDRVLASTGATMVNILAHSEGSAVGNYYLLKLNGGAKVYRFSGIGGNYYGTTYMGMSTLLQKLGLYDHTTRVLRPLCKSCFELVEGSLFYKDLNANGDTVAGVEYLNIVSKYDEFVVESGFMRDHNPNVRNVYLQDLCSTDHSMHFGLTSSPVVFNAVNAFFSQHANKDVGCGPFQ